MQLQSASYDSRLCHLLEVLQHSAPFVVDDFWDNVNESQALTSAHQSAGLNACEDSNKILYDSLVELTRDALPQDQANLVIERSNSLALTPENVYIPSVEASSETYS
jgi:hypothetical protein